VLGDNGVEVFTHSIIYTDVAPKKN